MRKVHPAAELFPLVQGAEFAALVADIERHGLRDPIVIDVDGSLIDGRNRARACEQLGIDPETKVYEGDDIVAYVVSHNLHRRHLTDSQRAMIAAELATLPRGTNRFVEGSSEPSTPTRDEAASMMGVSRTSVHRAKVIHRDGTPELVALVKETNAPLATLARVASKSRAEQLSYVEQVRSGADPIAASNPSKPVQSKPTQLDTTRDAVAFRVATAKDLAATGHTSRQIAKELGMSGGGSFSMFRRRHGVDVPADAIVGRRRRLDSVRIVTEAVASVDGVDALFEAIDYDALPDDKIDGWLSVLDASIRSLTTLKNELSKRRHQP